MSEPAGLFDADFRARAPRCGLRPERSEDRSFLIDQFVACSPMAGLLPAAMLVQQAGYQLDAHNHAFPHAMRRIALRDGRPVGRFMIDWSTGGAHGVDLAVLPGARGGGVGLHFLRAWVATCDVMARTASLEVVADNPAASIYRRLGFVPLNDAGAGQPVIAMTRAPQPRSASSVDPTLIRPS